MDKAFLEQMKKKVDHELREKEISITEFWKQEAEKILHKKTESLSALQVEVKNLIVKMDNRIKMVKRSSDY